MLRECANCGGEATFVNVSHVGGCWGGFKLDALGVAVTCRRCGMSTPSFMTTDRAVECWNRRVCEPESRVP